MERPLTSFSFPAWTNKLGPLVGPLGIGVVAYMACLVTWGFSPKTTDVGFQPLQPIPYSHAMHAGKLGINCLYCHVGASGAQASVPPTETCMNCHAMVKTKSAKLAALRESWENDTPVEWVKVHDLPDYVYFNHSAHTKRGVGCVSCHGRVDRMEVVYQQNTLSMGWCLECHRNPEAHLRPQAFIPKMDYVPDGSQLDVGARLRRENDVNPPTDCSTCHR